MKARFKLIASCLAFALVIGTMAFGVYAAVTVSHTIQNSIGYQAGEFHRAKFSTVIKGASQTAGEVKTDITEIDDLGPYEFDATQGTLNTSSDIGTIYFVSKSDGSGVYEISFVISVANIGEASKDEHKNFKVLIDYSGSNVQTSGTDIIRSAEVRTIGDSTADSSTYTSADADTVVNKGQTMVITITYTMQNEPASPIQNNLTVSTLDAV